MYLETSIISYLAAWPSRDLIIAANQQATHEWWVKRRSDFELVISDVVRDEIAAGDQDASRRRLNLIHGLRVIAPGDADKTLALRLVSALRLPSKAAIDALHVAVAAVNGLQYLLTWNCAHIANAAWRPRIESVCRETGFPAPLICIPPELM